MGNNATKLINSKKKVQYVIFRYYSNNVKLNVEEC